jgi:hypothetical protein
MSSVRARQGFVVRRRPGYPGQRLLIIIGQKEQKGTSGRQGDRSTSSADRWSPTTAVCTVICCTVYVQYGTARRGIRLLLQTATNSCLPDPESRKVDEKIPMHQKLFHVPHHKKTVQAHCRLRIYQANREQRSFAFVIFWQKRLASHLGPCWSHTIAADATDLRMYWMAVWVTHAVVGQPGQRARLSVLFVLFVLCYVALSSPDGITDGTVDSRQLLEKVMPRVDAERAYIIHPTMFLVP